MEFQLRHTNFDSLNLPTNLKGFKLPYHIELILKDSLNRLEPKNVNSPIMFDLVEKYGIFSAYVNLDQFTNGVKWGSRYIVFKQNFSEFDIKGNMLLSWGNTFTYFDSNVIDKTKIKNHEPYFKIS